MSGTIRARTDNGDVVFNARTGKVCKGDYHGIEAIEKLQVGTTAANLKITVEQLVDQGCRLVYCTFKLKSGGMHPGVPYPFRRNEK